MTISIVAAGSGHCDVKLISCVQTDNGGSAASYTVEHSEVEHLNADEDIAIVEYHLHGCNTSTDILLHQLPAHSFVVLA